MKQVYFIIAMLCGLALGGQAQGIRFAEGSWKELLETAKKEGKLIFVDCYTEWCQPCKQMEQQVFPSKKVGKFYNEHFINVKMDMEKGEGPVILNTYKINAFPTLLFVNGEGGEVYRIVGSKKEAELLQVGADALASKTVYPVNSQAQQQIALIGREIPDFCYRDSTGKEVKFSSFRGNYVYVDMWATWCRPCCEEIAIRVMSCEKDIFRQKIYRYQIAGLNEQYIDSYSPELIVRSLPPGNYRIMASCSTKDGNWTPLQQVLSLTILPPWYKTWWFIMWLSICLNRRTDK